MTIEVTMKVQGFSEWQTGGTCRAYGKHLPAGGCILITGVDGYYLPVDPHEHCLVRLYNSYGHPVGDAIPMQGGQCRPRLCQDSRKQKHSELKGFTQ
jgi:hypothetical protein